MVNDKIAIIIRHAGEPTLAFLQKQVHFFFARVPVEVISAGSFEQTLKLSYEKGLAIEATWIVMFDADILLSDSFVPLLANAIKSTPDDAFGFSFRVWDRFYDAPKYRGVHVYKRRYLAEALPYIPISASLRPETEVKQRMARQGHAWVTYGNVVGLHDFFQRPEDIFAKMAMRAHRSSKDLDDLKTRFQLRSSEFDFRVAAAGIRYGESAARSVITNFRGDYAQAFSESGLAQQNKTDVALTQRKVNRMLVNLLRSKVVWFYPFKNRWVLVKKAMDE